MIYIQSVNWPCPLWKYTSDCIFEILKKNYECRFVNTKEFWDDVDIGESDILICYCIFYDEISNLKMEKKIKMIIINTEGLYSESSCVWSRSLFFRIYEANKDVATILEYQAKNIKFLKSLYPDIKCHYVPPSYNKYYEELNINKNEEKDIDVLVYGAYGNRRINKIIELKHNGINTVYVQNFNDIDTQLNYINRSKIILNIFYYENNKVFDFFRNTLLLSNKAFLILEEATDIDKVIDKKILDYQDHIITCKYENICDTVNKYLNISQEERDTLAEKSYNWYKNILNYEKELNDVITTIL